MQQHHDIEPKTFISTVSAFIIELGLLRRLWALRNRHFYSPKADTVNYSSKADATKDLHHRYLRKPEYPINSKVLVKKQFEKFTADGNPEQLSQGVLHRSKLAQSVKQDRASSVVRLCP